MNELLTQFLGNHSVAYTVFLLSLIISLGLLLGNVKIFGVKLGIAGVIFVAIFFAHFNFSINQHVLEFVRDFGLILFVYSIGMQVGYGFFVNFKQEGFKLNLLALSIVLIDILMLILLFYIFSIPLPIAIGMLSGSITNTPSLGAAIEILKNFNVSQEILNLPLLGYAVTYPFGVIGIILTIIILKTIFKIDIKKEVEDFDKKSTIEELNNINIEIKNPNITGISLKDIPSIINLNISISRLLHDGQLEVAKPDTKLNLGDIIHVIGPQKDLEKLKLILGEPTDLDLRKIDSELIVKRILVTKKSVLDKSIEDLGILNKYDVSIPKVIRAGIELVNSPGLKLQFGDILIVVGEEDDINKLSKDFGDSIEKYNEPNLVPMFIGIILGIILGNIPLQFPGIPVPVKLGIAGGPLIVSIILTRINKIGPFIWHMPLGAKLILMELGITLFLACVGLRAGDKFLEVALSSNGLIYILSGSIVTLTSLLIVGIIGRVYYKINFMTLCGLLSGSRTNPPALAFANGLAKTSAPSIGYATVYPLVMLLRIISAQIILIVFYNSF